MHLANLFSLVLFIGFALNFAAVELPRQSIKQLDPENVSYCQIDQCPAIEGLVLSGQPEITSTTFGERVSFDFTNTEMKSGKRMLWLKVEDLNGGLIEMVSTEIQLDLKNRTIAEFLLVSEKELILGSKLSLGY